MSGTDETTLNEFTPECTTESITRTITFPLRTSRRKNELVRTGIEEFQAMAAYMADMLPSYPEYRWTNRDTTMYRMVRREFPEAEVKATIAREAAGHVAEAFRSWRERGKPGSRPEFGDGDYLVLSHQDVEVAANDRGYGLKASFIPYKPEWFHVAGGDYQDTLLDRAVNGDGATGSAELHLDEDGTLTGYLTLNWDVEVYKPGDVSTTVGTDIGEAVIYAAAVVHDDEVLDVEMKSGREFRHFRKRLDAKRKRAMKQDDLQAVRQCRGERERYTEQVLDTASRRIVELAVSHRPAVIALEDLTHYRETAEDPIHDWPYAQLREKIAYKATEEGIPVTTVHPQYTSITCRRCGQTNPEYRDGTNFECTRCGYEVHADVNAAINIAYERDS